MSAGFLFMSMGAIDARNGVLDRAWLALSEAETGSYKDPFIRTTARKTPGGSTAFGPVQLTGSTAEDYANRGVLSPESQEFYRNTLAPMYENFRKYGNEPNLTPDQALYDYGGTGGFDPNTQSDGYNTLTKEIMQDMMKRSGGDMQKFIQLWRGVPRSQDERYYKTALEQFQATGAQ
jgi:hypothetical protein